MDRHKLAAAAAVTAAALAAGTGTAGAADMQAVHYFGQTDNDIVSTISYGNNHETGKYAKVDDARIYYEVYGSGNPILVLHGGGVGCTYEMGRFIDLLSEDYQVIAPSTRGHGKSEIGVLPITYEQKALDMMAPVNAVTNKSFIILGFSDGAYTAYKIASMYPERVRKIVAIGAGENLPSLRQIPLTTIEELSEIDRRFMSEKLAMCPQPSKLADFLKRYYTFFNQEKISKELFTTIVAPVLLVTGELDTHAPLDSVLNAYRMIPKARLAVIANAPHQVFITNFDAVWSQVEAFLKDPDAEAPATPPRAAARDNQQPEAPPEDGYNISITTQPGSASAAPPVERPRDRSRGQTRSLRSDADADAAAGSLRRGEAPVSAAVGSSSRLSGGGLEQAAAMGLGATVRNVEGAGSAHEGRGLQLGRDGRQPELRAYSQPGSLPEVLRAYRSSQLPGESHSAIN